MTLCSAGSVLLYLVIFTGVGAVLQPNATAETLLIRAFGTCSFLLLHVALAIGPLCRIDRRFLPLLYNRRHLGVTMFLLALVHGIFSLVQFHALGDGNPLVSLFTSNTWFGALSGFPFLQFGFAALLVLFLMAATSHDFWLHTLTPGVWKRLHMLVYAAYLLLIVHLSLQSETSRAYVALVALGFCTLASLHIAAGVRESRVDRPAERLIRVGEVDRIPQGRL
jgi:sulfoxide reductase heme-binding subunit YedZ